MVSRSIICGSREVIQRLAWRKLGILQPLTPKQCHFIVALSAGIVNGSCWKRNHIVPATCGGAPRKKRCPTHKTGVGHSEATCAPQGWWERTDSNHRSHWRQIYSLLPLAARELSLILPGFLHPRLYYFSTKIRFVKPFFGFIKAKKAEDLLHTKILFFCWQHHFPVVQ